MKILKKTATTLEISTEASKPCSPIVLAVGASILSILTISFLGKLTTLQCNRTELTQISCQHTTSVLMFSSTKNLDSLSSAKVEKYEDDDNLFRDNEEEKGEDTYQLVLVTSNGQELSFTGVADNGSSTKEQQATEINVFLQDGQQQELTITTDNRLRGYFLAASVIVSAVGMATHKNLMSCTFDKRNGKLYCLYQNTLQSFVEEENLEAVRLVRFDEKLDDNDNRTCKTSIVLKHGEDIVLSRSATSSHNGKVTRQINQFLGIPS